MATNEDIIIATHISVGCGQVRISVLKFLYKFLKDFERSQLCLVDVNNTR